MFIQFYMLGKLKEIKIIGPCKNILVTQYYVKCDNVIVANFMGSSWKTIDDGKEWTHFEMTVE